MAPTSGILYVTMQPKESLPPAQFHDWYQNEHGPNRLRLSFCKNGFRYRASDITSSSPAAESHPEWMAIYDIEDMEYLTKDVYTRLRRDPVQSQRERDTMKHIKVDRRFYDFLGEWKGGDFSDLQAVDKEGQGNVLIAVSFTLYPGEDKEKELEKWYNEEHVSLLQKVPGWRRTRRFVTSYLDLKEGKAKEFLALHEYAPQNGLGGEEFKAATSTKWNDEIYKSVVQEKRRRTYDLYYTFGPASRDLGSLYDKATVEAEHSEGKTKTHPASTQPGGIPAIEGFVTTKDGVELPYLLQGSPDVHAPLLILANSILVAHGIWDDFVAHFIKITNNKYRIARYNTRGRTSVPSTSTKPIKVETLAEDVIAIADALRAPKASVVGVSLGGATALYAGLTYPDRIEAFVSCDTNAVAPASNKKAWGERIEMCEKEGAKASSGEPMVGEDLAEATVQRWFPKESHADQNIAKKIAVVKTMIKENSLSGFRDSVNALYEYDFRGQMGGFKGKGAFVVGAKDGVLPKTMAEMATSLGKGTELKAVEGAGHLPMVERPEEVAEFVANFLG